MLHFDVFMTNCSSGRARKAEEIIKNCSVERACYVWWSKLMCSKTSEILMFLNAGMIL